MKPSISLADNGGHTNSSITKSRNGTACSVYIILYNVNMSMSITVNLTVYGENRSSNGYMLVSDIIKPFVTFRGIKTLATDASVKNV